MTIKQISWGQTTPSDYTHGNKVCITYRGHLYNVNIGYSGTYSTPGHNSFPSKYMQVIAPIVAPKSPTGPPLSLL